MIHDSIISAVKASVNTLLAERGRVVIAIDGRCASGKTTLAAALAQVFQAPVIHMDHFFLRPHMRTPERLNQPGGNVDKERFSEEVIPFLRGGKVFTYRPFDCHTLDFSLPVCVPSAPVILVEGSYACCPDFRPIYDLSVFLTVDPQVQLQRIAKRNGDAAAEIFRQKWIPLEEAYFRAFDIKKTCDLTFDTTHSPAED